MCSAKQPAPLPRAKALVLTAFTGLSLLGVGMNLIELVGGSTTPGRLALAARAPTTREPQGALTILEDSLPSNLNPFRPRTLVDLRTHNLIYEGMFSQSDDGSLGATMLEVRENDDNSAIFEVMDKRMGVRGLLKRVPTHNKTELTVSDLKCSLEAMAAASSSGEYSSEGYASLYKSIEQDEGGVAGRGFQVMFHAPQPEPKAALGVKLVPCGAFTLPKDPSTFARDPKFNLSPVGTGPFRLPESFSGIKEGTRQLVLNAFREYHQGPPRLAELRIEAEPSAQEKIEKLRNNQAHVLVTVDSSDKSKVQATGARALTYYVRNWWYIGFNQFSSTDRVALFSDLRFRKAFALSLDRDELVKQLTDRVCRMGGTGAQEGCVNDTLAVGDDEGESVGGLAAFDPGAILISGPFVPESPYYNKAVEHLTTNASAARDLIKQIPGVSIRVEDGIRRMYYREKAVTLDLAYPSDLPGAADVATRLRTDMEELGIRLNTKPLGQLEWESKLPNTRQNRKSSIDLTLGRWNFDQFDDIAPLFHSAGSRNMFGFKDAKTDAYFQQFQEVRDYDKQTQLMRELHAHLAEQLPCVFLWEANQISAFAKSVRNYKVLSFSFYIHPDRWYLKKE